MNLLKMLKSLLSGKAKAPDRAISKNAKGIRHIFETPYLPSLDIRDEISLYRVSIPDLKTETLSQHHLAALQSIQGIPVEASLLIVDMMSVCHTGNPLFNIKGSLVQYKRNESSQGLNISLKGENEAREDQPSALFNNLLSRLKKTLETSQGWGKERLEATLVEFLPGQGYFSSLEVAIKLRQAHRHLLTTHHQNRVNVAALLDNPDHMLIECIFPSGYAYPTQLNLDGALAAFAMGSYYKNPVSAGYAGLNACIALPDFVSAIHFNRCLYSEPTVYEHKDAVIWLESSLSKLLYPQTPEKNAISGEGSKNITTFIQEEKQRAEEYESLVLHRHKFEAIKAWLTYGKEPALKKRVQHLFSLLSQGKNIISPLTAVEDKRLALHRSWLESRSEQE